MEYIFNKKDGKKSEFVGKFTLKVAKKVCKYHKTFPEYNKTPLVCLTELAKEYNVKNIFIKDESKRFGLNSFKVLGGTYSIGKEMEKCLGLKSGKITYKKLTSKKANEYIKKLTFVSATDGNHGRGVAWTSTKLGAKAIIYLPKGSAKERIDNILATGAKAEVTSLNYDDTVRVATKNAKQNGYILVQDTAFGDYTEIPLHIMQGYSTLIYETYCQLKKVVPTHVFLQAGVGSMAGALTAFFANVYSDKMPKIVIVEPQKAGCVFESAKADDGKLHFVTGDLETIMAGLSCGEPCSIGFDILNAYADCFVKIEENIAKVSMKTLAKYGVVSGESGGVGLGTALEIIKNNVELKEKLGINENSVMLFVNTEGDTDKENYQKILAEKE